MHTVIPDGIENAKTLFKLSLSTFSLLGSNAKINDGSPTHKLPIKVNCIG